MSSNIPLSWNDVPVPSWEEESDQSIDLFGRRNQMPSSNVANASAAIYAAAAKTGLTTEESGLLENWSALQNKHKELIKLDNEKAQEEFNKLDPAWQSAMSAYFNTDYIHKPQADLASWQKFLSGGDGDIGVTDYLRSPFRALFALGDKWYKAVNAIPGAMMIAQSSKKREFNLSTINQAYNGENMFNDGMVDPLIEKHGDANAFVAMHLLQGQTPGEIIEAWGQPGDPKILVAVSEMFDETKRDQFESRLEEFRQTQLSVGRMIANPLLRGALQMDPTKHKTLFNVTSGTIDFVFQVVADPMTYLSFGQTAAAKGISSLSRSSRLAEQLRKTGNYDEFFADKGVRRFWDGYGSLINERRLALENKDINKAAEVTDKIKQGFKEFNTDEDIDLFTKRNVKDADSALAAFKEFDISNKLLRGRTDSLKFAREGAVFSRATREFTVGAKRVVRDLVKGKAKFDDASEQGYKNAVDEIMSAGASGSDVAVNLDVLKNTKDGNRLQKFINLMSSKHPLNSFTYLADDFVARGTDSIRQQALLLTNSKVLAETLAQQFYTLTPAERITFRKGMDIATMQRMGLDKVNGGKKLMDDIINDRYGANSTMGASSKIELPHYLQDGEELKFIEATGAIHGYQFKQMLGPLPYAEIAEHVASHLPANASKAQIAAKIIGASYDHKAARLTTDVWRAFTLLPRMGIRTVIDEGFMFSLYLNGGVAKQLKGAQAAGNVLTAATGSTKAVGAFKRLVLRDKSPDRLISEEERKLIFDTALAKARSGQISFDDFWDEVNDTILGIAVKQYGKNLDLDQIEYLRDAFLVNPRSLEQAASSEVARATVGLNSALVPIDNTMNYAYEEGLAALGAVVKETFSKIDLNQLNRQQRAIVQQRNLLTTFTAGALEIDRNVKVDLVKAFFKYGGLRDKDYWDAAMAAIMREVGIEANPGGGWQIIADKNLLATRKRLENFLQTTRQMDIQENTGAETIANAVHELFSTALSDMYVRFHGSAGAFNEGLLNAVRTTKGKVAGDPRIALANMDADTFARLTDNFEYKFDPYTDVTFDAVKSSSLEDWWAKWSDQAFDIMDRQINDMFRQPVVISHYFAFRNEYKPFQAALANKRANNLIEDYVQKYGGISDAKRQQFMLRAEKEAARVYTQKAFEDAGNHVLKYSDNPSNRSVLAFRMRTVGAFYRAVEDFHRRMFRLVSEHPLDVIYRLRLMQTGIGAIGAMHKDENGDPYLVLPMDDVMFSAVDTTLRALSAGKVGVNQPLFNDFTLKLTAGNPSFQDDAGMPYLAGPVGAFSVMNIKAVVGLIPGINQYEESVDDFLLGSMSDNPTFTKMIPGSLRNIYGALVRDEKSQQETTAIMQAIAYNQANGIGIDPDDYLDSNGVLNTEAFNKAKEEYLSNVRISAHNVLVMRTMFNLISPISSQMKESKDLPDYLKDVGEVNMSQSFYEVLDKVEQMYPNVPDHYELALATWTAENPGKLAYIPSRTEKEVGAVFDYSKNMQNWMVKNKDLVDKYGTAVVAFAPGTGEFSSGVYNWAKAAGFVENRDVDDYFKDVVGQEAENAYWDLADAEDLELSVAAEETYRRIIISKFQNRRELLKLSSPYLAESLKPESLLSRSEFVTSMYNAAIDPALNLDDKTRKHVIEMYAIWESFDEYCNSVNEANYDNGKELKRQAKDDAIAQIYELIALDDTGVIKNMYRSGIKSLINNRSRDSRSTISLGN